MGIKSINGCKVIGLNVSYKEKYWPALSEIVKKRHAETLVSQPKAVENVLIECFDFLCSKFSELIAKENRVSFFLLTHYLHEDSILLWKQQLEGVELQLDKEEFAGVRRILKIILEQGCKHDLKGCNQFFREAKENYTGYINYLEELIYVGYWAFGLAQYVAQSQIAPGAISVQVEENELTLFVNQPYNSILEFVMEDYHKHKHEVVVSDLIKKLKEILESEIKLSYDRLCDFIFHQVENPGQRWGLLNPTDLLSTLQKDFGYAEGTTKAFYAGLTISKINVMSVENCILKTQDINRYTNRPILNYHVDGKEYWMIGANKWLESLTLLTTNAIPFGIFPEEWKVFPPLMKLFKDIQNTHDKILENPTIELLKAKNLKYDSNIKNFKKKNNQNLSLVKESIGEIDLMFLDEENKVLFIAECKHNRSRTDFYSWKRDISNFTSSYEKQLTNKYKWVEKNIVHALEHFETVFNCIIEQKDSYTVTPVFIINAPTLYMYDSSFLVLTIYELGLWLNGNHIITEFNGDYKGTPLKIRRPYFQNTAKAILSIQR